LPRALNILQSSNTLMFFKLISPTFQLTDFPFVTIVLHAGNENGFINNASLVFKSGSKKGDYHDNMNRKNFENWFKNQLIPNLSEKSLINAISRSFK